MKYRQLVFSTFTFGLIAISTFSVASAVPATTPINTPSGTQVKPYKCGSDNTKGGFQPAYCSVPAGGAGSSTTTTTSPNDTTVSTGSTTPESGSSKKLANTALLRCEKRQDNINKILGRIVTRGTNQMNLFMTIVARVEAFKTSKNVTVANYDSLVAAITADQTKITTDLAAMQANGIIDCTASNPKGMVSYFQKDLKQEIADLKSLKTDVKNLIVAVKTNVQDTQSKTGSAASSTTGGSN